MRKNKIQAAWGGFFIILLVACLITGFFLPPTPLIAQQNFTPTPLTPSEAERLAELARQEYETAGGQADVAALLAVRSLQLAYTPDADLILQQALSRMAQVEQVYIGANTGISSFAISPDGQQIVVSYLFDATARVFDVATGQEIQQIGVQYGDIVSVAWSPDGKFIATGGQTGGAYLWDAATGEMRYDLMTLEDELFLRQVAFTPHGQAVMVVRDTVQFWDVTTGELIQTLVPEGEAQVQSAALHPDGQHLFLGSTRGEAWLLDIASGQVLHHANEGGAVDLAQFTPDGTQVIFDTGLDGLRFWNVETGAMTPIRLPNTSYINALAFSPDGKFLLTDGAAGVVTVWDMATWQAVRMVPGGSTALAFSADGQSIFTGRFDGQVRRYPFEIPPSTGHYLEQAAVGLVALAPDGQLAAVGNYITNTIALVEVASGEIRHTLRQGNGRSVGLAFSADSSQLISAGTDERARIFDTTTGRVIKVLGPYQAELTAAALSPDGNLALLSFHHDIARLIAIERNRIVGNITMPEMGTLALTAVAYGPDGNQLATGGEDGMVRVWDTATQSILQTFFIEAAAVFSIAFSADGSQLVVIGSDRVVQVFDLNTGTRLRFFSDMDHTPLTAIFSADGRHIMTGGNDGWVREWPVEIADDLATACAQIGRDLSEAERAEFGIGAGATCSN